LFPPYLAWTLAFTHEAGCISEGAECLRVQHHLFVGSKADWDVIGDDGAQHVEGLRSPPP